MHDPTDHAKTSCMCRGRKKLRGAWRRITLFTGLMVFLAVQQSVRAQIDYELSSEPLSSACEYDYPPFCIVEDDGAVTGFSIELLRAAMKAMDREVSFQTGTWEDVRGLLERGEIDALPLVGRTPERESLFDFTVPYMSLYGAIVVRRDERGIQDLADLKGLRVAVMKDDNAEEFLRREARDFEIHTTATYEDAFHRLSDGQYDAVVTQRLVALRLIQDTGLTDLRVVNRPLEGFRQDFCFAVTEGDRETLALLNEGLALVMADGAYRHLHSKWFASLELPTNRRIVFGGDYNYPPYEFLDENGRPAGYTVELTRAIAREMGIDFEIRLGPWSEIVEELERGDIDAIQGMFYSTERDLKFDFTQSHMVNHYVTVVRKGEGAPPSSIEELKTKRIVVQKGDFIYDYLVDNGLSSRITTVETHEDVLTELHEGNFDCGVMVRISAMYFIEKLGYTDFALGKQPLKTADYCYAVHPDQRALLAQLSEGLKILDESGEYRRIYEKWMGVYDEQPITFLTALRYSALVIIPLLILIAATSLWSWSLRKQVAQKTEDLRENMEKFQYVFESANVGKSLTLPSGEINANKAFADFLGYSPKGLRGKTWQEITPPEEIETTEKYLKSLLASEQDSARFEKRYIHKNGQYLWADVSTIVRRDKNGDPLYLVTTIVDITGKKRAEEALRASEEFQRAMIACSPVALYCIDNAGIVLSWNSSAERIFGWTADEVLGKPLPIVQQHKQDEFLEVRKEILQNGGFIDREIIRQNKDGALIPLSLSVAPLRNDEDETVGIMAAAEDITLRKQAEEALRHSEGALRNFVENAPVAIAMLDNDMRYVAHSRRWIEDYRLDYDNLAGLLHYDVFPDMPEWWKAALQRGLAGEVSRNNEDRFELADGTVMWLRWELQPWRKHDNSVGGIIIFTEDITEQKRMTEALAEEEARRRILIEQSRDGIVILDQDGKVYEANHRFAGMLGYALEDVLELSVWDWEFLYSKKQLLDMLATVDENGDHFETRHRRRDGTIYDVEISTNGVHFSEQKLIFCVCRDITERKQTENEIRLSAIRWNNTFDAISDIVAVVSKDHEFLEINKTGCDILGMSKNDIIGRKCYELIHNMDKPIPVCPCNTVLETRKPETVEYEEDGRYYELSAWPIDLDGNEELSFVHIVRDITDQKESENEKERIKAQLVQAQKMETIGRLAGGVAHDFNNLLTIIAGNSEFAIQNLQSENDIRHSLMEIQTTAKKASNITQQLLAFSRKQTIAPEVINLTEIVTSHVPMLQRLIGEDIDIITHLDPDLWNVEIDPSQFDQILMNFAVNSRDAIEGVGSITIETENVTLDEAYKEKKIYADPGDYVMLMFSDSGSGMNAEVKENIFEPFFTTKGEGKGTGLGLSTVYGIVKQNNGIINAYSEPEMGTTFKVYLPRCKRNAPTKSVIAEETPLSGNETVLVVEDDEHINELTKRILEQYGYTVIPCLTTEEAIHEAETYAGDIHLLLTDVVMPNMNGKELTEHIKTLRPDITTLFMSGYTANVIVHRGVIDKGVNFIQKPFSMKDLARKVRQSLDTGMKNSPR